ncbi:MAG: damage-inducible protein DinB [Bacteroidia bacterium]|nr:damage-inducible protein DinB [Bacteroidia bacterium]
MLRIKSKRGIKIMHTSQNLFEEMNAYNLRVNLDLVKHLIHQKFEDERAITLMSHIVNAHQIWNDRVLGKVNQILVFGQHTFDEMKQQIIENSNITIDILNSKNLDEVIEYKNTKGQTFTNSICQIFLHIFNHSSYHRGQINQLLSRAGKEAMISDYIFYNRTALL